MGLDNKEYSPHHIVQSGAKAGKSLEARELLDKYQIDINSPSNGVALKRNGEHMKTGMHDNATKEEVLTRLKDAERAGSNWGEKRVKIIEALGDIKTDIFNNTFPAHRRAPRYKQ